jgi:hypothetical protein
MGIFGKMIENGLITFTTKWYIDISRCHNGQFMGIFFFFFFFYFFLFLRLLIEGVKGYSSPFF